MLNKMDTYLLESIKRLERTGYKDENPRGKYESDGAPANAITIRGGVYELFDIAAGEFPISFTRFLPVKTFIGEICTIYQDQSSKIADFEKNGVNWWDNWDIGDGSVGLRYGATVKEYNLMDDLLEGLVNDPYGRRHIIDLYQYEHLKKSKGLHPCAFLTMWTVANVNGVNYLDLTLIQRSSDYLVAGTGINQAQYVALQMMVAKHCGYEVGLFEHYRKNVHVYDRHFEQLGETIIRLEKMKKDDIKREAKLILNVPNGTNFYDIKVDDFEIVGYDYMKPQLEKFDLGV